MNCKNCQSNLNTEDKFCNVCGAKVIRKRISARGLFSNLIDALGWDTSFFLTLRLLAYRPQIPIKAYLDGTRKKYANPFSFFAINLAISLFVFTQYSDKFIEMSTNFSYKQSEVINTKLGIDTEKTKKTDFFGYESQEEFSKASVAFQVKYYNLFAFLTLPFYTLIAFLVFRKPYNYGEHLIINTYIQGFLILPTILLFAFSLLFKANLFLFGSYILMFLYYTYTYKKLYAISFDQLLVKLLRFFGILFLFMLIPILIGVAYAVFKLVSSS